MAETRHFTCIVCPRGCSLEVDLGQPGRTGGPEELAVRGNACRRGEEYGRREILDPRRSLTSTIRARGLARRRLPVRTSAPIPLGLLLEAAAGLDGLEVSGPVACGDVIVPNFMNLGVDLVATDSLDAPKERQ